ncbi:Wadjet anti-phage system protein JetD domain-containing protein [Tessaracoccus sp.]
MTQLSDALRAFVHDAPRQKILIGEISAHASHLDQSLIGAPDARARLCHLITELADQGVIVLPRSAAGWDTRNTPALPQWVSRPALPPRPTATVTSRVWPDSLAAAALVAERPDEIRLLTLVADWMRRDPNPDQVPLEERSLDILDDEKLLALELTKRLFTTGTLTLGLLAAYRTPIPFASQHIHGTGPTKLLVAENNATYHSLVIVAREQPEHTRQDLQVAWGSGKQFPASIASVPLLDPAPTAIFYFGDLDLAGLQIPVNAAVTARTLGLPEVHPAAALYEHALAGGTPRPDRSNTGTRTQFPDLLAWLPKHLRSPLADLLAAGNRIPQEIVGQRELRQNPHLLNLG